MNNRTQYLKKKNDNKTQSSHLKKNKRGPKRNIAESKKEILTLK